jgi:hypothetical protein
MEQQTILVATFVLPDRALLGDGASAFAPTEQQILQAAIATSVPTEPMIFPSALFPPARTRRP